MAMVIHGLYFYLIENFGVATAMLKPTWSLITHVYFTVASDLLIRIIFGKRVWTLSHSYVLTAGIASASLACAATGIIFVSKAFHLKGGFADFHLISVYLYTSLATGVAADLLIAISLCVGLMRTRTGFKRTDSLVNILMAYSINTSLLTTVCSIGCFITYAIWPQKLIFLGIYFCLSKLYFNSLLAALNARQILRDKMTGLSTTPTSITAGNTSDAQFRHRSAVYGKPDSEYYELESGNSLNSPGMARKIVVSIDRHVAIEEDKTSVGMAL
ncbi:hypothetical protein P691DRAFT_762259 [Macrolepiota fuliginosa MF-IS2]|uniref:DUF6534 domain-containing protein n=1 Tax=Macrolepiota fuliginosa MF-IS2 TaxID=1400762 RepID=A0A9P5X724_9AGAR|nr:hypothetical protein P691DRAFT_762259 [Macrolepiota fuliginosa MF-IS2]